MRPAFAAGAAMLAGALLGAAVPGGSALAQPAFNAPAAPASTPPSEDAPAPPTPAGPRRDVPLPPMRPFELALPGGRAKLPPMGALAAATSTPAPPNAGPGAAAGAAEPAAGAEIVRPPTPDAPPPGAPPRDAPEPLVAPSGDDTEGDEAALFGGPKPDGLRTTEAPVPDLPGVFAVREAPTACLPEAVRTALVDVAARFGPVAVLSTHRGPGTMQPRRQRRGSYHLGCRAADFRVRMSSTRDVLSFLRARPELGGIKVYFAGFLHIDDGPRRSW